MTARSKTIIKSYFTTGSKPTQAQFEDLVDSYQDFGSEVLNYEIDTGTANTYVITPDPAITSYTAGLAYAVKIANTNTGASTLNVNGLGAKNIVYVDGSVMASNALPIGAVVLVIYDGSNFILANIAPTTSTAGISALTGDVTASGSGSVTATIQSNAVTTTKIADNNVTYAKISTSSIATASEIQTATASKLVDAAQLLSALRPYSTTTTLSGTDAPFTSIPSGVRRIVLNFSGASTSGTGLLSIEIGDSGGYETSGYVGAVFRDGGSASFSASFLVTSTTVAGDVYDGVIELYRGDSSTNTWHIRGTLSATTGPFVHVSTGTKSLTAELDRLRVVAGGNSWDAGKITCEAFYF